MSYILDALKKAEQKRQQETAPTLLTVPYTAAARPKGRPWRTYLLAAALLLNAAFLLWWLRPWQQPQHSRKAPAALSPQAPAQQPVPLPPAPTVHGARDSSAVPEHEQREQDTLRERPVSPPAPAAETKILPFGELPPSVQQSLPALQIAGHFYSASPSSRIVSINGRTVREGEEAAEGVTVERITPDGVILSFRGYRFHRGVF
ncbi:MAG: general secretion pathway protein GspB [Thermodesulfovibrionales bacterium]